MSFLSFGTNPIATRFLAVHFFAKKIPFSYKPEERCGSIGILHSVKDS